MSKPSRRGVGVRAATLVGEERTGAVGQCRPGVRTGDTGQEGLGGAGRAGRPVGQLRGSRDRRECGLGLGVGGRSVRRLVRDDGGGPVRPARGEFEGETGAVADADEDGFGGALGVEDGDEVVDMDGDIDRRGFGETARAAPPAVDRVDGHVARGREKAGEAGQLGGGGQRPVEEEHVARAVAERPVGDARAVGSVDPAVARRGGVETGTEDGALELAARASAAARRAG